MYKKNNIKILTVLFLIVLSSFISYALPPFPTEFYGNVTKHNDLAPTGVTITAYNQNNELCGQFNMINTGHFGSLSCIGDDPLKTTVGHSPS